MVTKFGTIDSIVDIGNIKRGHEDFLVRGINYLPL